MAGHKTMVEKATRCGGGGGGIGFCLCKITHNNNNILRCYGVPLTVQMEESVKFPGGINAFPTLNTEKSPCLCVWETN